MAHYPSHRLAERISRRMTRGSRFSSSLRNSNSKNNSKRPLISVNVINDMNKLLNITEADFKTENLVRSLTAADVKILSMLLIKSTKLGMMRKLSKKKTNISDPKTIRELLKVISIIEPNQTNFMQYNSFINLIETILHNKHNYMPNLLDTYPVYETLVLRINQRLTPEQEQEAAALNVHYALESTA